MAPNNMSVITSKAMALCQKTFCLGICIFLAPLTFGAETADVEEMVITGVPMNDPLTLTTDPKSPRQPLPAQDGADYLKTIPGFSVIRKGGTSGDPVFRGMAGSRLSLLLDGNIVLGGCSSRMDPPTAYVFPETYDTIRLIKGPQTVLYGSGNSAGVVLFERDREAVTEPGWQLYSSLLTGSFGRNDEVLDISGASSEFYVRGMASHSQQDDYTDGDDSEIHSQYDRWSTNLSVGWTPTDDITLELTGGRSDAEAAYADRGMDGSRFARDNLSLKLIMENLTPRWQKLEAQVYHNQVDQVMDNYTLREPTGMMPMPMASNPERQTEGARIVATLAPTSNAELAIGVDTQSNDHTDRSTMDQTMMPYQQMPRIDNAYFEQVGLFGEWTQKLSHNQRVIGGWRIDDWRVEDRRETVATSMMMQVDNPTANSERDDRLHSGFARYEKDLHEMPATLYAGVGRSERFPDYWELISIESRDTVSAFGARPETTTQLDIGALYRQNDLKGSVSLFYNKIDDYLLIESGVVKPAGMMTRNATVTRNIDATSWGMEADISYAFSDTWRADASVASVRGTNDTDHAPLAQLPPLELRLGLYYSNPTWSAGAFWRAVDNQSRVDIGKGNIAGQDIGPSESFNVFSLNIGWQLSENLLITSGIDNLFDETYAEHISRAGAMIPGFQQTTRVNEPGRNLWLKAQLRL